MTQQVHYTQHRQCNHKLIQSAYPKLIHRCRKDMLKKKTEILDIAPKLITLQEENRIHREIDCLKRLYLPSGCRFLIKQASIFITTHIGSVESA